jgi:bacteriorhodopsin
MAMPGGWLGQDGLGLLQPSSMDLIYNIGDAINKIGFGLVVYGIAMSETKRAKASA